VLIPALDEESDIEGCIASIAAQDHPLGRIEVVLVDGGSRDGTVAVAHASAASVPFASFRVVDNPRRRTSIGLQRGLEVATGEYVVRIDARSRVQPDYVRTTVGVLTNRPDVGVVGGAQVPSARSARLVERGIARALRNRYTTGLSRYRRASGDGPADTVWMGVFRTAELRELGGWDERVALNEDWELNARYRAAGRVVWFLSGQRSRYLSRSTYRLLARQYFRFGRVKGLWWMRGQRPEPRQVALVAAPPLAAVVATLVIRRVGWRAVLAAPLVALVLDELGSPEPPTDQAERVAAVAATAVSSAAWWTGIVVGTAADRLGVEHEHGVSVS
jgi:glycosyltransferase involved in cell wall biosynthesis